MVGKDLISDGLRTYSYDAEGRLSAVTTGGTDTSPTTRYAHNALGQRVFKTEPLFPPTQGDEADAGFMQSPWPSSLACGRRAPAMRKGWALQCAHLARRKRL